MKSLVEQYAAAFEEIAQQPSICLKTRYANELKDFERRVLLEFQRLVLSNVRANVRVDNVEISSVINSATTDKEKDDCASVMVTIIMSMAANRLQQLAAHRTGNIQESIMKLEAGIWSAIDEFLKSKPE